LSCMFLLLLVFIDNNTSKLYKALPPCLGLSRGATPGVRPIVRSWKKRSVSSPAIARQALTTSAGVWLAGDNGLGCARSSAAWSTAVAGAGDLRTCTWWRSRGRTIEGKAIAIVGDGRAHGGGRGGACWTSWRDAFRSRAIVSGQDKNGPRPRASRRRGKGIGPERSRDVIAPGDEAPFCLGWTREPPGVAGKRTVELEGEIQKSTW